MFSTANFQSGPPKTPANYRGRFAPSPTGPLHFGSMVAAVASYLDAKANGGEFLVRIEDIDTPRCVTGADRVILSQLKAHGLEWDGPVVYQSQRGERYAAALERLRAHTYPCACTRREMPECRCRDGLPPGRPGRAIRLRGEGLIDDFVLRRADGLWAYQLAVVVDDAEQGITHVVRGADLAESTPGQRYLHRLLGYRPPQYFHVPVALDERGQKLSKQNRAPAVPEDRPWRTVAAVLRFLGFDPPDSPEVLRWGIAHWYRRWAYT
jgi:glutamyl-Q tRNA(Asp) synthetase